MTIFTNLQSNLSNQILNLRSNKGWTQFKVAERLNTSRAQVCRLEDPNDCRPSINTLVKLAKIYRKDLVIEFVDRD